MIVTYPSLPAEEVTRQGSSWLACDVASCPNEAEIVGVEEATVGGTVHRYAPMPEGWVTNDPDDNALHGAAQFCATHASRVVKPSPDEGGQPAPPPVTEPDPPPPE